MEQRIEYVEPIETFEYVNSLNEKISLKVNLYITKYIREDEYEHYRVYVGSDNYDYRESMSCFVGCASLEEVIEESKKEYYGEQCFQMYVTGKEEDKCFEKNLSEGKDRWFIPNITRKLNILYDHFNINQESFFEDIKAGILCLKELDDGRFIYLYSNGKNRYAMYKDTYEILSEEELNELL